MSQPHLLLLPGLACDEGVWKHQARALSRIAQVRIADYGSSDSIEKMALRATQAAPERFALAGHSMGGRIAFEIMRRMGGRVTKLAVLDTAYRGWVPGEAGERERAERLRLVDLARSQGMRVMAQSWVQYMVHRMRLSDAALIDRIVEMFDRKSPEIFVKQIKALLERPDATAVLGGIGCPTLVLCGREDAWSTLSTHREIAALVPKSKFVAIQDCGHMSTMERPEEVTEAMTEWLCGGDVDARD